MGYGALGQHGRGSAPAPPTLGHPISCVCLSPPFFAPVSFRWVPTALASCFPLCVYPHDLHTSLGSSSHGPAAQPHQPCPRKPRWAEAVCSHSDWPAGARGGSHHHTRTGSRKCILCPGKGSPAGSGAGSSGLSGENREAGLRHGPSPSCLHAAHPQTPSPAPHDAGPKDKSGLGFAFKGLPGSQPREDGAAIARGTEAQRKDSISPGKGS